jgi:hypothetical protein
MRINDTKRREAKKFLRLIMSKLPQEQAEILAPLLGRATEPPLEVREILAQVKAGKPLEKIGQGELVKIARAVGHVAANDSLSWIVHARKADLLNHIERNRDALDLLLKDV